MSEFVISQSEVTARLRELQDKYNCSNREFLSDPEVRVRVSDEDDFEWEAYLTHLEALREYEDVICNAYLSHVSVPRRFVADKDKVNEQLAA